MHFAAITCIVDISLPLYTTLVLLQDIAYEISFRRAAHEPWLIRTWVV